MTPSPFKQCGSYLRSAIVTGGTHSRVCRFVAYHPNGEYAVYVARGGRPAKSLVFGRGTQAEALLHGCADNQFLNCPGVWKAKGVGEAANAD